MNQKQQKKYNKDKCRSESGNLINIRVFKKDYTLNPSACASENDEYLGTIFRDLVVTRDESTELSKNTTMNFNDKKSTCKIGNFYILFASLLITILLFIIISRYHYYYHVKHK